MITLLFQRLPGPSWLKAIVGLALVAVIFYFLFEYFYPLVHERLDGDMTVSETGASAMLSPVFSLIV